MNEPMNKYLEKIAMRADVRHFIKSTGGEAGVIRKQLNGHYAAHSKSDGLSHTKGIHFLAKYFKEQVVGTPKTKAGRPRKNVTSGFDQSKFSLEQRQKFVKNYVAGQKETFHNVHSRPDPMPIPKVK